MKISSYFSRLEDFDNIRRTNNVESKKIDKKMSNVIHPKLDHDMVDDFEEEDDDPIAALPFKVSAVNHSFVVVVVVVVVVTVVVDPRAPDTCGLFILALIRLK